MTVFSQVRLLTWVQRPSTVHGDDGAGTQRKLLRRMTT